MKEIYLAGGCFWGMQAYFQQLQGVIATEGERMIKQNIISSAPTPGFTCILYPIYKFVNPFFKKIKAEAKFFSASVLFCLFL